jgi:hypothetical protein
MYKCALAAGILCVASVISFAQLDCSERGQIEGTVLDSGSRPVERVRVSILSEQCAVIGIQPRATTDSRGHFLLSGVPVGLSGVYGQKPEAGYPDTTAAIYLDDSAPPPKVTVHTGERVSGVIVRLGNKAGSIFGEILDADTLQPVISARIRLSIPDNERIMFSKGTDRSGRFELLVPARPIRIVVSAPGYESWELTDVGQTAGIIRLEPDEKRELNIKLNKQKT